MENITIQCENVDSNDVDAIIENMGKLSEDDLERVYDAAEQELNHRDECGMAIL